MYRIPIGFIVRIDLIKNSVHDFIGKWVGLADEDGQHIGLISIYLIRSYEDKI